MSQIVSNNTHDILSVDIIPVIASFDPDGNVAPLYVRIDGESYKVYSYRVRKSYGDQLEFQCKLQVGDMLRPIIVTYYLRECIWTIPGSVSGN